jgi:hypothetical protein
MRLTVLILSHRLRSRNAGSFAGRRDRFHYRNAENLVGRHDGSPVCLGIFEHYNLSVKTMLSSRPQPRVDPRAARAARSIRRNTRGIEPFRVHVMPDMPEAPILVKPLSGIEAQHKQTPAGYIPRHLSQQVAMPRFTFRQAERSSAGPRGKQLQLLQPEAQHFSVGQHHRSSAWASPWVSADG